MLLDGYRFGREILARVRAEIAAADDPDVCLATVLVGGDRNAEANLKRKHDAAQATGMRVVHRGLPPDVAQSRVEATVAELAAAPSVHGIFVQLPLAGLDAHAIVDRIPVTKDVDGMTIGSAGRLMRGVPGFVPAATRAILGLLTYYGVGLRQARALLIGASPDSLVPLALILARAGAHASVTIAGTARPDLDELCRAADIVVSAADDPRSIGSAHIARGAAVIDAGAGRVGGELVGDVNVDALWAVAGALAPMPGGVGPATIACLLENVWLAAKSTPARRNEPGR